MGTITIEIDEKHALVRHIESLQEALTKRNETIERLQARLDAGEESPLIQEAYARGHRDGWRGCSERVMDETRRTINALNTLSSKGFDALLERERAARQASTSAGGDS